MNMPKRVITKVGDVFRTKEGRLIQLVGIDKAQLSSDVVVVYSQKNINSLDELKNVPTDFYQHTTVSAGVKQGLWEKVGKSPIGEDLELCFKDYVDGTLAKIINEVQPRMNGEAHWAVWSLGDQKKKYVSESEGRDLKAEEGDIVPPRDIISRIKKSIAT